MAVFMALAKATFFVLTTAALRGLTEHLPVPNSGYTGVMIEYLNDNEEETKPIAKVTFWIETMDALHELTKSLPLPRNSYSGVLIEGIEGASKKKIRKPRKGNGSGKYVPASPTQDAIMAYMQTHNSIDIKVAKEVVDKAGLNANSASATLSRLSYSGLLNRVGYGIYEKPGV